ncbi:alpha/beta-hydrolase [Atractiella rhizophila]|nr:alpha/beta-hydrolase [Atractiella rhizophila]
MIGILALLALSFVQFTASVITPVGSDAEVSKFPVPPFAESPAGKWITGLGPNLGPTPFQVSAGVLQNTLNLPQLATVAAAAYCNASTVAWNCLPCQASGLLNPTFWYQYQGTGTYPGVYVATFSNAPNVVFVFREGSSSWSELWDDLVYSIFTQSLDPSLINAGRGAHPTGAEWIHGFFQESYLNTNQQVLAAVKQATARFLDPLQGLVVLTGHSLGAAVSVLDSLQLRINLDPNIAIQTVGYGQPRVGNDAFALYYDQLLGNNTLHYTNWRDPVPRLPEQILGFVQTQNEFFNQTTYECLRCPDCSICDANKKPDEPGCDPFTCNPNQGQVNYCPVDPGNGPPPFENYKCAAQFGAADDP